MKLRIKFKPIQQTVVTRSIAAILGILLVIGVLHSVFQYTGNPIVALYTQHKIASYFEKQYPDKGYVVGPVEYTVFYTDNKPHYFCRVYNPNEIDTGFSAYYEDGQLMTTKQKETDSGNNTYNRFKTLLGQNIDTKQLYRSLTGYGMSYFFADFYPGSNNEVFNASNPVFVPNSEYDPNNLPLPTVFYAFFGESGRPTNTIEDAAAYLVALKNAVEGQGLHFDYYSADIINQTQWSLLDVPTDKIPTTAQDTEESTAFADLVDYLNQRLLERSAQPSSNQYGITDTRPANSADTLVQQKSHNLMYSPNLPLQ